MKIVVDFGYGQQGGFWEGMYTQDPLHFPVLRAVETFAGDNECHFFNLSWDDELDETFRGVYHHTRKSIDSWLPMVQDINPDIVITNSSHGVSKQVVAMAPNAKSIYVCHGEPVRMFTSHSSQFWPAELLQKEWGGYSCFVSPLDIGVEQIHALLPEAKVRVIPFGVNLDLCAQYNTPVKHRNQVACSATWADHKGGLYADAVLASIRADYRQEAGLNWGDMKRRDFLENVSKAKLLFFPSYSEGTSKIMTEAAAMGTMPVVAVESGSNVEHARKLGGVAIRTGMYLAPTLKDPYAVKFTRPADEVARHLVELADNLKTYSPDLSEFDARLTIDKYVDLIRS